MLCGANGLHCMKDQSLLDSHMQVCFASQFKLTLCIYLFILYHARTLNDNGPCIYYVNKIPQNIINVLQFVKCQVTLYSNLLSDLGLHIPMMGVQISGKVDWTV
jgi:hypothetical protein